MAKAKEERPLTPRQARFVEEYLKDLNATQAAIRAGYSEKTAEQLGYRLLRNVQVAAAIAARMAERSEKVFFTQESVLVELHALAKSNVTHYQMNPETGLLERAPGAPENAMAAVSSVEYESRTDTLGAVTRKVKFKLWDKPGTLKLAGRHVDVKGFFEKMEVTGKDGGPLSIEDARDPSRMTTKEREARLAELLEKAARAKEGSAGSEPPA